MKTFVNQYLKLLIVVLLALIWGSSFILMKRSLEVFSPVELGSLRMVFASFVMLPFAYFMGLKLITRNQWKYLVLFGLIGNAIPAFLFALAQTHIDSSLAGILNALTPLFTMLVGFLVFKIRVKSLNIIGVIIGFIGASAIIYTTSNKSNIESHFGYASLIVLATVLYAFNINMLKNKLSDLSAIKISVIGFSTLFIPLLFILLFFTGFRDTIKTTEAIDHLIYPATLGVVCSAGAIILFNKLIKISSALFASSVTYLIPIVALAIGIFDGEIFKPWSAVWIVIILAGVLMANKK